MAVVTVSRQLGSLGSRIAREVARELGYRYLDRAIIAEVAREQEGAEGGMLARMGVALESEGSLATLRDTFLGLIQDVVREVYREGNAVIVGRGAHRILNGMPRVLHVSIRAPREFRMRRCSAASPGEDPVRCGLDVDDSDRRRAEFMRTFYDVDWLDPELYHLTINTGHMSVPTAVRTIIAAVHSLELGSTEDHVEEEYLSEQV